MTPDFPYFWHLVPMGRSLGHHWSGLVTFCLPAGFAAYRDHPDHVALVQRFIAGHTTTRVAVQYLTD